jgi:hypothetical protein
METVSQNVVVVIAVVIGSVLFTAGLNAVWPVEKRRSYNDLVGWQLTILGTTYAVILGFMLYTVWTKYDEADLNVNHEASALGNLYRVAEGIPEPQLMQLQTLARSYAEAAVSREWPQMANGEEPNQTDSISSEMWKTVVSVRPTSRSEIAAQDHAMSELHTLAQYRLIRLLESANRLPNALWCVLLVGGALTIISACMFGVENAKLQIIEVLCLSLLICLSLVAIADIHRPFRGLIHVRSDAFQHVLYGMQND